MASGGETAFRLLDSSANTVFSGTKYNWALFLPIKSLNKLLGYLVVGRLCEGGFSAKELKLYSILAQKAFDSIENILLKEELYYQSITDTLTGL